MRKTKPKDSVTAFEKLFSSPAPAEEKAPELAAKFHEAATAVTEDKAEALGKFIAGTLKLPKTDYVSIVSQLLLGGRWLTAENPVGFMRRAARYKLNREGGPGLKLSTEFEKGDHADHSVHVTSEYLDNDVGGDGDYGEGYNVDHLDISPKFVAKAGARNQLAPTEFDWRKIAATAGLSSDQGELLHAKALRENKGNTAKIAAFLGWTEARVERETRKLHRSKAYPRIQEAIKRVTL